MSNSDTRRDDIENWTSDLLALGWKKWNGRFDVWLSPNKAIYRGPYLAWCVATGTKMRDPNAK